VSLVVVFQRAAHQKDLLNDRFDIELTVKEIFKEVQKKGRSNPVKYTSLFDWRDDR
jgi:histidinol dehydrogenase